MSGKFPKAGGQQQLAKPFPPSEEDPAQSDPEVVVGPRSPQLARPEITRSPMVVKQPEPTVTYRGGYNAKMAPVQSIAPAPAPAQVPAPAPAPGASWSQIVRTSATKLPAMPPSPESPPTRRVTRASLTPSPPPAREPAPQLVVEEVPPTTNTVDFYRGPKVDPRWPVSQQVFLGPIPMSVTWDEIRNIFYTKVQRRELLHFYVQSKPVNEVVYGQVVFDKVSLANKIVKEGPVKVSWLCLILF